MANTSFLNLTPLPPLLLTNDVNFSLGNARLLFSSPQGTEASPGVRAGQANSSFCPRYDQAWARQQGRVKEIGSGKELEVRVQLSHGKTGFSHPLRPRVAFWGGSCVPAWQWFCHGEGEYGKHTSRGKITRKTLSRNGAG